MIFILQQSALLCYTKERNLSLYYLLYKYIWKCRPKPISQVFHGFQSVELLGQGIIGLQSTGWGAQGLVGSAGQSLRSGQSWPMLDTEEKVIQVPEQGFPCSSWRRPWWRRHFSAVCGGPEWSRYPYSSLWRIPCQSRWMCTEGRHSLRGMPWRGAHTGACFLAGKMGDPCEC